MWYAIYETATGRIVSLGTSVASPLPAGLAAKEVGATRPTGDWDPVTLAFVASVPVAPRAIDPIEFMRRFTMQEEAAIRAAAKSDPMVEVLLARLTVPTLRQIHLDHPETQQGMAYLVQKAVITQAVADRVLA